MARTGFRKVAELSEVQAQGVLVVKGGRYGIALFCVDGRVYAVDNRCPHLGFPLHMGTVNDGILTCHWHNAQFDLCTGGTFDPFADDVPVYPVEVRGDEVWLNPMSAHGSEIARAHERLREGLRQNIDLVVAKAVISMLDLGVDSADIVREGALHGARYRAAGWQSGLTILTAMTNVLDTLGEKERLHALYEGLRHVASDCAGQPPSFRLDPLSDREFTAETLERWFRRFVETRRPEGAERVLLTAVEAGTAADDLAGMLFRAATDHFFRDGGHVFDFTNKACELLDQIGWEHAGEVLPTLVVQLSASVRSEETNPWRHPIDLVTPLRTAFDELPDLFKEGAGKEWRDARPLREMVMADDPLATIAAMKEAIRDGARPYQLGRVMAFAAAERVARFNTQNDFDDWIAVAHTLTYSNAVFQALRRVEDAETVRGVFHGAMAVYMDRFFNVPPARLPWERKGDAGGVTANATNPNGSEALLEDLLEELDGRQHVEEAAAIVHGFIQTGGSEATLWQALGRALLREDVEFHTFQVFEAGYQQFSQWDPDDAAFASFDRRIFVMAVVRYLAAHAPTMRQAPHIADVARRLQRGEALDVVEAVAET